MAEQYEELLPFLHDRNPAVRSIALENLLPQTVQTAPHRNVFLKHVTQPAKTSAKDVGVFRDLKLLCRDQPEVATNAFKALVNLSDSVLSVTKIVDPSFLDFLVSYILNRKSLLADTACMLLSNLTSNPIVCQMLLILKVKVLRHPSLPNGIYTPSSHCSTSPSQNVPPGTQSKDEIVLPLLLNAFVAHAAPRPNSDTTKEADLHYLASVFANVSTVPNGRAFWTTPYMLRGTESTYPLSSLIGFTEHPDVIRRGGVLSTIKNCSFHKQAHRALLSPESELVAVLPLTQTAPGIDILPSLLLPLAGPEEFELEDVELLHPSLQFLPDTKQRETDHVLRTSILETLILLGSTRWGRGRLRETGTYEIIRMAHESETNDNVIEAMETLVNLLKRDEGPIEEGEDLDGTGPTSMVSDDDEGKIVEI